MVHAINIKKRNNCMRALEILIESKTDFVLRTFGEKINQFLTTNTTTGAETPEQFVDKLAGFDPTPNQKYLPWIARTVLDRTTKLEDASKLKEYLVTFERVKNQLEKKDINSYKDGHELYSAIKDLDPTAKSGKQEKKSERDAFFAKGEVEQIYRDGTLQILHPKTKAASCYFGQGTQWCTAATKSENYFDTYNKQGPIYIINILGKKDERYQVHFESGQFMDIHDEPADWNAFLEKHPAVATALSSGVKWVNGPAVDAIESMIDEAEHRHDEIARDADDGGYGWTRRRDRDRDEFDPEEAEWDEEIMAPLNLMNHDNQKIMLKKYPWMIKHMQHPSKELQRMAMAAGKRHFKHLNNPDPDILAKATEDPRGYGMTDYQFGTLLKKMPEDEKDGFIRKMVKAHPTLYHGLSTDDRDAYAEFYYKNGGTLERSWNLTDHQIEMAVKYGRGVLTALTKLTVGKKILDDLTDEQIKTCIDNDPAGIDRMPDNRINDDIIRYVVRNHPRFLSEKLVEKYTGDVSRMIAPMLKQSPLLIKYVPSDSITPLMAKDVLDANTDEHPALLALITFPRKVLPPELIIELLGVVNPQSEWYIKQQKPWWLDEPMDPGVKSAWNDLSEKSRRLENERASERMRRREYEN